MHYHVEDIREVLMNWIDNRFKILAKQLQLTFHYTDVIPSLQTFSLIARALLHKGSASLYLPRLP
jgi:hypothetical protein